jgi:hypothetical protein
MKVKFVFYDASEADSFTPFETWGRVDFPVVPNRKDYIDAAKLSSPKGLSPEQMQIVLGATYCQVNAVHWKFMLNETSGDLVYPELHCVITRGDYIEPED